MGRYRFGDPRTQTLLPKAGRIVESPAEPQLIRARQEICPETLFSTEVGKQFVQVDQVPQAVIQIAVMKKMHGKAKPDVVGKLLKEMLR